jgi:hypothetical protein
MKIQALLFGVLAGKPNFDPKPFEPLGTPFL